MDSGAAPAQLEINLPYEELTLGDDIKEIILGRNISA
jgi:hypothetical protein